MRFRAATLTETLAYATKLLLLVALPLTATCQEYNYRFHTYKIDEGLINLNVNAIFQDDYGFMWFGTDGGFCRYDGYEFEAFEEFNRASEPIHDLHMDKGGILWIGTGTGLAAFNTLSKQKLGEPVMQEYSINAIAPAGDSALWLGTSDGLFFYSLEKDTSTHIRLIKNAGNTVDVFDLMISTNNKLWISTTNKGLISYDLSDKFIQTYQHDPGNTNSITSNTLRHIAELDDGRIAIGTESDGVNILDEKNNEIIKLNYDISDRHSVSSSSIYTVWPLAKQMMLAGSYAGGLNIVNLSTGKARRFLHDPKDPSSIPTNSFRTTYESKDGNIWIGTYGSGVIRLNPNEQQIVRYLNNKNNANSLSADFVRSVYEDDDGSVWIGTQQRGLNHYDPVKEKYTLYLAPDGSRESLSRGTIWSLHPGHGETLWMGTSRGIGKMNKATGEIKFFEPKDYENLLGNNILKVLDDGKGKLWVGSWYGGLNILDVNTEKFIGSFTHNPNDENSINSNNINEIYIDKKERAWIGSDVGLCLLLGDGRTFKSFPTGSVLMIAEDHEGMLWLSTTNGLLKVDPESEELRFYAEENEELSKTGNIVIDAKGFIWLSTDRNVFRFDPNRNEIVSIGKADGIVGNHNNSRATWLGKKGAIYLGGVDGLVRINSDMAFDKPVTPKIQLTNFLLFNKPIDISQSPILDKSIHTQPALTLSYKDYLFAIEFAALEFSEPASISYEYKLENFDDNWISTNSKFRKATFTNVPPGSYEFKVRLALDSSSEISVPITIIPPWWETWWAKTLYVLSPLLLFLGFYHVRVKMLKRQKKKLEILVTERTTEISQQNKKLIELRERERELSHAAITSKERQLATMSMTAHEKNNLLKDLEHKVSFLENRMSNEMRADFKELKKTISNGYSLDNSWDSFLHNFQEVHPQFFDRLKHDNPRLTNDDLKISAYLKIGMTNKDIANVTNLTLGSVKSKINRLKKKLDLNAEDSVRDFMLKYAS